MSDKYEVEKLFKIFYTMIENQFQTQIKILHSDNRKIFPEGKINCDLPLKVFGCTMYVHLPSKLRSKLDPSAEKTRLCWLCPK